MKKLILIILIFLGFIQLQGQELFFKTGRNFTTYDFKNSNGETNSNLEGSSGSFYELGYALPLESISPRIKYVASLTLNQFNATGGNFVNNYRWNTNYLGLQNGIKYNILGERSAFGVNLNFAINIIHIINGEQKINGSTYNLTKTDEFKGLFIQPLAGLDITYFFIDNIALGLGYNISKSFGMSSSSDQKLNFNNSQLQFILNIVMN